MKRISVAGVVIGNIADIVCTRIVIFPFMMYILISSADSLDAADLGSIGRVLMASSLFRVGSGILGALCSVLGGYVSARIAKHDDILNGALSSILCVAFGLYARIRGIAAAPLALHLAFLALSPALGAFGGYLNSLRKPKPR
jgi:hypothetical protein